MRSILSQLAIALFSLQANAITIERQSFEPLYVSGTNHLALHGAGLLKVGLFFKVSAAALYVADPADAARILDNVPKRLEIAYLRSIDKKDLIAAAEEHLRSNFKPAELAPLRERIDRINALYANVKPGDRYALTYLPGEGCTLALNGQALGNVPGEDFARVYFDIWLGPGCSQPAFRNALLKKTSNP